MRRRDFLLSALAKTTPDELRDIAAVHVAIAEKYRDGRKIWGRIGGSPAEHESAAALASQLRSYLPQVKLESFRFHAHRAREWQVQMDGRTIETAMVAPFEARFPDHAVSAPLAAADPDRQDWSALRGKWALVHSNATTSTAQNIVREKLLYQRAVQHGAAGLLFSLATPKTSRWKSIVPVDKPYALKDERYPGGLRPIPCFSMDAVDGAATALTGKGTVSATVRYDAEEEHEGRNVVGFLPGSGGYAAGIMCHLDSFFGGACDNASGMAAMVGLARELSRLSKTARKPDLWFLGMSAHHDEAAGTRAWGARDAQRLARIRQLFLLEHVDALDTPEGHEAGWHMPLNNNRTAYFGSGGWPEVKALVPTLVRETGVMTAAPAMQDACIADLFVTCDRVKGFCLMNTPPYYHTDHDTLDKISAAGIGNAVRFHLRLLQGLQLVS